MRNWSSIVAVSTLLSAGLLAGRAAADFVAAPAAAKSPATQFQMATQSQATWSDPPSWIAVTARPAAEPKPGPSCTASAWAEPSLACMAQGRPVRVIALTRR